MKKLWFALLFLAGGLAHEVRNPASCQCIASVSLSPRRPKRGRSLRCERS
ncbi:hypothetical protein VAPA_1c46040 [Variovorax paradoxus B4]|uniref:Uncharacterized protein n=1 Tax=Variovorax paradoxus B4 TaxID=1246301 RepID=T1XFH9_VARPD|nr:hypothetical protein VAPA_1c46040 [Variovorax paradoxus B4]